MAKQLHPQENEHSLLQLFTPEQEKVITHIPTKYNKADGGS